MSSRDPLWYKDAIIYEVHVKSFFDSNGDGYGDFRGLIEKLDYLEDLGVTALWLLPFYPSPLKDDGYDISDYRGIHRDYGTLRDFRAFVREAHPRGLRVITELVVNHTSDQHPWFQAARRARSGSARREFFVWSETDDKFPETRIIFTDTETSNWAWDSVAGAYYWHRFFSHQPDLNHNNPKVVDAVTKVMRYWLDMGVDGMRLDAVPYLCVREGTNNENLPETHAAIKRIRAAIDARYDDKMLLAEANQWPADVRPYFGDGDECHMAFHFPLMPRIFMALSQEDRRPITEIISQTPDIPESCQWALFLRNHDELTLEMVTDEERDYMYSEYAREPRMRVNVGIRRRLAPLVNNSMRRMEMLNSLLLSFPGTPIIYYGDEIGMGDNIYLGDRDGVRTPMQWSADRNAGFSRADPARLYLPVNMDSVYGYEAINVEAQQRNPSSLLHFMRRMIGLRRQHKAFGRGTLEFLRPRNRKILAYLRRYQSEVILCVANLSRFAQPVELDLREFNGWRPLEMIGHTEFPLVGELPYLLTLGPHAFYWFRLEPQAEPIRITTADAEGAEHELPVLSFEEGPDQLLAPEYRYGLAQDVIAPFLPRQRWFRGKAREVVSTDLVNWAKVGAGFYIVLARVTYEEGADELYALPLKISVGDAARRLTEEVPRAVLASVRLPEGDGVLFDALADRHSIRSLFVAIADQRSWNMRQGGRLHAYPVGAGIRRTDTPGDSIRALAAEQSNTSIVIDDHFILKLFRRLEPGVNPDLEIGRFLSEKTDFRNAPAVHGAVTYEKEDGVAGTVALLQKFVPNDGDGWTFIVDQLQGVFEAVEERAPSDAELGRFPPEPQWLRDNPVPETVERLAGPSLAAMRKLGERTAEFHLALSRDRRSAAFRPERTTRSYLDALSDRCSRVAQESLTLLSTARGGFGPDLRDLADEVLSCGTALITRFETLGSLHTQAMRIRCHGDYHLGQVLRVGDDFLLIDFEGEPLRSLRERREKASPLRDVAGMLRSLGYAAHTGLRAAAGDDLDRLARLQGWAAVWESWCSSEFVRAYLAVTAGAPFIPEPTAFGPLLESFLLEKAFYELSYELNNRPDWVRIPLAGIAAIGNQLADDGTLEENRGD